MADCLDNVPRVADLEPAELLTEHGRRCRPVILTEAFAAPPSEELGATRQEVMARLGDVRLPFRPEYGALLLTCLRHGPPPEGAPDAVEASLAEYWQMVQGDPETPVMCAEEATPEAVAAKVGWPRAARGDSDAKSTVFVGNAGNVAPIHFDGDCRHVLLHQLFGRKLVVMLPVGAAEALRPVVNFSTLLLRGIDPAERQAMVRALGGWECVLMPGETVLMPALIWHGVVYLDDGMSVNFRIGRHRKHRFISEHLHLDERVQAFAAATLEPASVELGGAQAESWRRLVTSWAEPAPTPYAKYQAMRRCLAEIAPPTPGPESLALPDELFAHLPEIAVQALVRAHLFNQRSYLPGRDRDLSGWL